MDFSQLKFDANGLIPAIAQDARTNQVLMLEVYPGEGSWDHFQDDGESFAYRDGVYNQYHCELKDGKLTVSCVHDGYEKHYQRVQVHCLGKTFEAELKDGACCVEL